MKLITNILLRIVSVFFFLVFSIPGLIHDIIDALRFGSFYRRINYSFLSSAIALDIASNVAYSNMLNAWFIKHGGYHFGVKDETVSSALGKNQVDGTLTFLGTGLASILGLLQKDHCYISINDKEYYLKYPVAPSKIECYKTLVSLLVFMNMIVAMIKLLIYLF